jgi:hypothetical protein
MVSEAALGALLLASVAALATSQHALVWLLAIALPALVLRLPRLPRHLASALERLAWLVLALTVLFGLMWSLYPAFPDQMVRAVPTVLGSALVALASVFFAGRAAWPPERAFVPAVVGALVVAALDLQAPLTLPLAAAGAALVLYGGWPRLRPGEVLAFGAVTASLALGLVMLLPFAQPFVEATAAGMMDLGGEGSTGFALRSTVRLGEVESLASSHELALRLWAPAPHKLRARVFTHFSGVAWSAEAGAAAALAAVPEQALPAGALAAWSEALPGRGFLIPGRRLEEAAGRDGGTSRVLPARALEALLGPPDPVLVRASEAVSRDAALTLTLPGGASAELYGFAFAPTQSPVEDAPAATLAVPAGLDPRLAELAARLAAASDGSAEGKLRATLEHLDRCCSYSLQVGRFQTQQPIAEFLFEKHRGYCEYFASAAALLLRLQGVPARYVTGYNVTEDSRAGDHYVVRESDAHAWIDAWLPGRGWVEQDPTPAGQYDAVHHGLRPGLVGRLWERLAGGVALLWREMSLGGWRAALRELGRLVARAALWLGPPALAVWALRTLRRRRRGREAPPTPDAVPGELVRMVALVEADLRRRGWPRPPTRAPLEHLDAVPAAVLPPERRETGRAILDCYYRARFGGQGVEAEIDGLARRWDRRPAS